MVLLDTGTPGTSETRYTEDAEGETRYCMNLEMFSNTSSFQSFVKIRLNWKKGDTSLTLLTPASHNNKYEINFLSMLIIVVCVLILIKSRWPKKKSIWELFLDTVFKCFH